jgi:hypothetical protein
MMIAGTAAKTRKSADGKPQLIDKTARLNNSSALFD